MPWTVLIADDEPKIRRGLTQLLAGYPQEFVVVGEAGDGEQALELLGTVEADLLLVDIRMPFVDGLALIRRLTETGADRRVVVISGHDEFDYARQAMSLGVFDYLLKPVEEDVLIDTLRRAARNLDQTRAEASAVARARLLAEKNRPALLEGVFREALRGALSPQEWSENAAFLGFQFAQTPQLVLVASSATARNAWTGLALRRVAEEAFAGFSNVLLSVDGAGNLAILADESREQVWVEALGVVETRAREALGAVVSIDRVPVAGFPDTLAAVWDDLVADRREASPSAPLATSALKVLERRYREVELTLDDVASELQVSPGHLSRVLKASTGNSFVEALARVRVRKASVLLADPAVKMYEVAEQVGYASQHYFSRAFRRVLGVAPSEYRKGDR